MAEISSKRKFYELWEDGCLGNRTQIFRTLEAALASGAQKVGFREVTRGGGKWSKVENQFELPAMFAEWKARGRPFIMDDGAPNDRTTIQGELCRTYKGLEGFIAVADPVGLPPMRISMAQGLHRTYRRLEVRLLLEKFMDPASRDDVDALFEIYPDAAIEFACFDRMAGYLRGRNTIIWEVRNY
jgi:hypothetical protein